MKRFILLSILASVCWTSCDFLDVDETIGKDAEYMYGYYDEVGRVVAHIYAQLPEDWGTMNGALMEAASDNATYQWSDNRIYDMYSEAWSASNTIDDVWGHYYRAIRSVNVYFRDFKSSRFDKFNTQKDVYEQMKVIRNYPYELRFLRAFFYFELLKRYKNIPLIKDACTVEALDSLEQAPFEDVVRYICDECDSAILHLPVTYKDFVLGAQTGRATKGAAMALKSRVLLYAASPLFNEGTDVEAKYQRAVDAAWSLIDSARTRHWYSIAKEDRLWGSGDDVLKASQLIFEKRGRNSSDFESRNFPLGYEGGHTGNCPAQNLVDAFEMADGSLFSWDDPEKAADPYADRDPRLDENVLRNGSVWKDQTIETFRYGRNASPLDGASMTGYYLKKYVDESVSLIPSNNISKNHHYVLFRYAEILLNYAEAMTEWKGHDFKDSRYTMSAVEAVNAVRARVGMPPVPASVSREEFIRRYRNERRVELAFEGHRFWDIRRWMIGPETSDIYGISIDRTEDGKFKYRKVLLQERTWDDKMYLYPISQQEMMSNPNWKQNPGW